MIFGPKRIWRSKMMKIFGKTKKSHYDVIVTSLWRHKAIFRTLLWGIKNFFLFNQISPNLVKVIIISWNYFLRVLVMVEKIDVIWRQKTWKWPFLAYFGPKIILKVSKFIKSVANLHLLVHTHKMRAQPSNLSHRFESYSIL